MQRIGLEERSSLNFSSPVTSSPHHFFTEPSSGSIHRALAVSMKAAGYGLLAVYFVRVA